MVDDEDRYDLPPGARRSLVMRLIVFQLKLLADGLRDFLLSPIAIAATVLGFIDRKNPPDHYFQRLLHLGRRSDVFIDLFDAHRDDAEKATTKAEAMAREAKRRYDEIEAEYEGADAETRARDKRGESETTRSP